MLSFHKTLFHPSAFERLYSHFQKAMNTRQSTMSATKLRLLCAKL